MVRIFEDKSDVSLHSHCNTMVLRCKSTESQKYLKSDMCHKWFHIFVFQLVKCPYLIHLCILKNSTTFYNGFNCWIKDSNYPIVCSLIRTCIWISSSNPTNGLDRPSLITLLNDSLILFSTASHLGNPVKNALQENN